MPNQQSRKNIPYYSTTRPKTPPSNLCPLKNFITTSNEQCQMQFDSANLRRFMSPGKWLMRQTAGCFSVLLWRTWGKNISEWFFVRAHSLTYIAIKNQLSWFFFPRDSDSWDICWFRPFANGSSELEFEPPKYTGQINLLITLINLHSQHPWQPTVGIFNDATSKSTFWLSNKYEDEQQTNKNRIWFPRSLKITSLISITMKFYIRITRPLSLWCPFSRVRLWQRHHIRAGGLSTRVVKLWWMVMKFMKPMGARMRGHTL